jgi:hypothetical protein
MRRRQDHSHARHHGSEGTVYGIDYSSLREIIRVLKPGGQVLIVAETYKGRRFDSLYRPAMMLLRATYLTPDEHRGLLTSAGFSPVEIFEEPNKGWLCAVGRKPAL